MSVATGLYSAAFDTVDHNILLTILEESFEITFSVLAWIRSFLTNRHQIFQVGPDRSPMVIVLYGLPQGTISIGPQMYIFYTVDLESILKRHGVKMHLYADDTLLYMPSLTNEQPQTGHGEIRGMFGGQSPWEQSASARTQSHKDRTHLAGSRPRYRKTTPATSSSNDLTCSSWVCIIDSGLTLVTHVSIIARNCFYQLRRIRQAKKNLDEGSVKTLIQALVLSRLDYCNSIL